MREFLSAEELQVIKLGQVGESALIHRQANIVFPERLHLGRHVRIDGFTVIVAVDHIDIASYVHIGSFCFISGHRRLTIGNFSTLSQGVRIYTASDDYSGQTMTNPMVPSKYKDVHVAPVVIGDHVIVGSGSVVLPGASIPEGVAIGALSLVKGKLKPWGIYAGVPARRIKERSRDLLQVGAAFIKGAI